MISLIFGLRLALRKPSLKLFNLERVVLFHVHLVQIVSLVSEYEGVKIQILGDISQVHLASDFSFSAFHSLQFNSLINAHAIYSSSVKAVGHEYGALAVRISSQRPL